MSNQSSQQLSSSSAAPPGRALPDINAETYPFDTVMHLLDQAAYLTLFSIPAKGRPEVILSRGGFSRPTGIQIRERLHRFSAAGSKTIV